MSGVPFPHVSYSPFFRCTFRNAALGAQGPRIVHGDSYRSRDGKTLFAGVSHNSRMMSVPSSELSFRAKMIVRSRTIMESRNLLLVWATAQDLLLFRPQLG